LLLLECFSLLFYSAKKKRAPKGAPGFIANWWFVSAASFDDPRTPARIFRALRIFATFVTHNRTAVEGGGESCSGENGVHDEGVILE
jgi:hypothetical protein